MFFIFLSNFLILFINRNKCNIMIPFKIKVNSRNIIEENQENTFINTLLFNTYYSKIEIGTPKQIIETQISCQKYGISLKEGSCLSSEYYNKKYSSSIVEKKHCKDKNIYNYYKEISINETISFQNDKNNKITSNIKDFPLIYFKQLSEKEINIIKKYGRKILLYEELYQSIYNFYNGSSILEKDKDGNACAIIGLSLFEPYCCLPNSNIISFLFKNNIIKDSNWAIKFYNKNEINIDKYDGEFIIGTLPHESSPSLYKKDKFLLSNALYYRNGQYWQIYFNDIYFFPLEENNEYKNKINTGLNSNAQFNFDIRVIFGTKKYYDLINEYFFEKYKDICKFNIEEKQYGIFKCNKNFNVENFPTLYFYHKLYNYTFELNYKDLFEEKDDKLYFLIAFDINEEDLWKLGTIFFRKYFFIFNTEEKTIGFYNNDIIINKTEFKYLSNILWIVLVIIAGVVGFFLAKKIYYNIRIKRINELNDNFIYNAKNKNNTIVVEMSSKK